LWAGARHRRLESAAPASLRHGMVWLTPRGNAGFRRDVRYRAERPVPHRKLTAVSFHRTVGCGAAPPHDVDRTSGWVNICSSFFPHLSWLACHLIRRDLDRAPRRVLLYRRSNRSALNHDRACGSVTDIGECVSAAGVRDFHTDLPSPIRPMLRTISFLRWVLGAGLIIGIYDSPRIFHNAYICDSFRDRAGPCRSILSRDRDDVLYPQPPYSLSSAWGPWHDIAESNPSPRGGRAQLGGGMGGELHDRPQSS